MSGAMLDLLHPLTNFFSSHLTPETTPVEVMTPIFEKLNESWDFVPLDYQLSGLEITILTLGVASVVASVMSVIFAVLDLLIAPHVEFVANWRIQSDDTDIPTWENEYSVILPIAFRNFVLMWLTAPFCASYYEWMGIPTIAPSSWWEMLRDLLVFTALQDTFFYAAHKMMHQPFIYGRVIFGIGPLHKMHHEFKAPCAIEAAYFDVIDWLCVNALPLVLASAFCKSITSMVLVVAVGTWHVWCVHSGYDLHPFVHSWIHDAHHEFFTYNFSTTLFWDYVFGDVLDKKEIDRRRGKRAARKNR